MKITKGNVHGAKVSPGGFIGEDQLIIDGSGWDLKSPEVAVSLLYSNATREGFITFFYAVFVLGVLALAFPLGVLAAIGFIWVGKRVQHTVRVNIPADERGEDFGAPIAFVATCNKREFATLSKYLG